MMTGNLPTARVELTCSSAFDQEAVAAAALSRIREIVVDLGLDDVVQPVVDVRLMHEPMDTRFPVQLRVNGIPVSYPVVAPVQAAAVTGDAVLTCAALTAVAISHNPSTLLTAAAVSAMSGGASEAQQTRLAAVLRAVVTMGISVRDRATIAHLTADVSGRSVADVAEEVIARLQPTELRIEMHPDYLRELTNAADPDLKAIFPQIRYNFLDTLGLPLPRLRLIGDTALTGRQVRFRINDLRSATIVGLPANLVMVDGTAERLATVLDVATMDAVSYAGAPITHVDASAIPQLTASGIRYRSPMNYVADALEYETMWRAGSLLTSNTTRERLSLLEYMEPRLVHRMRRVNIIDVLTRVLRRLLDEQFSIKHLSAIGRTVLEARSTDSEMGDVELVEHVRRALPHQVAGQVQVSGRVPAFRLVVNDPEDFPTEVQSGALVAPTAVEVLSEFAKAPAAMAKIPTIVVDAALRPSASALVRQIHPLIRVIGSGELPADLPVDVLGEIRVPAPERTT